MGAAAASLALVALGVGAVVYFAQRKPTETAVPIEPTPIKKDEPKPVRPDPVREFARWVYDNGGVVDVGEGEVKSFAALPTKPFVITGVSFVPSAYRPTDADVVRFRACPTLRRLQFRTTEFTDAGFKALLALPFAEELDTLAFSDLKVLAEALGHLARCSNLRVLTLTSCPLAGKMKFLAKLPSLTHLSASDAGLTDDDLAELKSTRVTGLVLSSNRKITDVGLEHLAALTLTELNISKTGVKGTATVAKFTKLSNLVANELGWTDADVAALRALTNINYLQLIGSPIGDRGLEFVRDITRPAVLSLGRTQITDEGLKLLHDKKTLSEINLIGTKVTLSGVKDFRAAVPNCKVVFDCDPKSDPDRLLAEWIISKGGSVAVTGLTSKPATVSELPAAPFRVGTVYFPVERYAITDADLDRFRDTGVYWFALGHGHAFTDEGLDKFTQFPGAERIKVLSLTSPLATEKGYAHLARLKNLEGLHLEYSTVTNEGLAVCRKLPKLKQVVLWRTPITDKGLEHLVELKLTHLELFDTAVTDDAAKIAGGIATLEKLNLTRTRVTDKALAHLTGLKNLKDLYLGVTGVTDKGLEHLVALPALVELELSGTAVTNDGLKHLARIKTLTKLDLRGTKVTADGVAALRKELPNCTVVSSFGAP